MKGRALFCFTFIVSVVLLGLPQTRPAALPQAGYEISGTLVDAVSGQPLPKARVAISPVSEGDNFTTILTAEDGRFQFGNLTPGKYTLTAQARGYLLQSFNQHDQYSSSIVVGPHLDSHNLLFRLPPESSISGVVSDEAGEPVRDAQVMLYFTGLAAGSEATRLRGQAMTNDEGAYHFGHLAPGRYLVAVNAKPWYAQHSFSPAVPVTLGSDNSAIGLSVSTISTAITGPLTSMGQDPQPNPQLDVAYPITFYAGVTDTSAATPIVLGQGEKTTADVSLQPVPALHIRLTTGQSTPGKASYFMLQRRVLDGPPLPVISETRQIAPGVMEVSGIPAGHYTMRNYVAGPDGSDWTGSRDVDVTGNGEAESRDARRYVPVKAALQVRSGTLSGQAFLQLSSKNTREGFTERIDSNGELVFRQGVPPGAYEVSLGAAPGFYLADISAEGAKVSGRTIEFRAGASVKLAISVGRGEAEVTGAALRDGKPLAGVMVVLVPSDPAHNQVLFRRDQSDSDGTFTLPAIVPGDYSVLALENGWKLEWTNPEVLEKFMSGAVALHARPGGKYRIKVSVQ